MIFSAVLLLLLAQQQSTESFVASPPPLVAHRRRFSSSPAECGWTASTKRRPVQQSSSSLSSTPVQSSLEEIVDNFSQKWEPVLNEVTRTCKVKLAPVSSSSGPNTTTRLGLVATQSISRNDVMLAMPYDDRYELSARSAARVFDGILPEEYDSWTGDTGLIALQILHEVARAAAGGTDQSKQQRPADLQDFMTAWVASLPGPQEMKQQHPLLWSEQDQEVLQSSSSNKIYRQLDDLEEDATWLIENVFSKDSARFPATCEWNGQEIPCFSVEGFKWAMALAQSRSFFLDGRLRLLPLLDMCNHSDEAEEVRDGTMGTFGTTKGAKLVASQDYKTGDEVFCSYGPKSAADYLLEHGFVPEQCWQTAVSELTFELDPEDRFHDDKLDILEYETYDQAPMDPSQSFDIVSAPGRDGEPDPAMIQFVRLVKLGSTDAFLLESIFRKEVWGFMELPVSEENELAVVETITEACQRNLDDLNECPEGGPEVCTKLRELEIKALSRAMEYMQREKEALDLKEYYQERRLKDLGLDSVWTPEDDSDLSFGQTRAPGGADYDW